MAYGSFNVLFPCAGNFARSLLADCPVNHLGQGGVVTVRPVIQKAKSMTACAVMMQPC